MKHAFAIYHTCQESNSLHGCSLTKDTSITLSCLMQATDYQVEHAVSLYFAQAGEGGSANGPHQTDEQIAQSLARGNSNDVG